MASTKQAVLALLFVAVVCVASEEAATSEENVNSVKQLTSSSFEFEVRLVGQQGLTGQFETLPPWLCGMGFGEYVVNSVVKVMQIMHASTHSLDHARAVRCTGTNHRAAQPF